MRSSIRAGLLGVWCSVSCVLVAAQDSPPTMIRGLVRDALTGQAVPGARVRIDALRQLETTSDSLGRYTLTVPEGQYRLELDPPDGYAILKTKGRKDVRIESGEVLQVDWSVPRALSVSGFTMDANRKILRRMPFQLQIANGGTIQGISDREGKFMIEGIPPNAHVSFVSLVAGQVTDRFERFEVGSTNAGNLLVRFYPAARVSGNVVTEHGDAVANAELQWDLTRADGRGHVSGGTQTDGRGRFAMDDVLFGRYSFTIKPQDGRSQQSLTVDVAPGANVNKLRLVYAPYRGLTIAGRIVDEHGNGVPNAQLTAGDTAFTFSFTAQTDEEGRFTLHDLKEGVQYGIGYVDYRGNHYQVMKRLATGAQNVTIRLELEPPGDIEQHIRGQVVDAQSGERIRDFEAAYTRGIADVIDETNPRVVGFMQRTLDHAIRDDNGNLALRVYRTDEYTVLIRAKTYGQWIGVLQAPADGVRIALEPESRVRGKVVDTNGNPVEGAAIVYYKPYGYELPAPDHIGFMGRTVSDGTFDAGGLAAGEHPITVIHPDYLDTSLRATAVRGGGEPMEIVMQKGGALAGTVYLNDAPHTRAWVNVFHTEQPVGYSLASDTESGGYYRIGRLAPGEYTIDVLYEVPGGERRNEKRSAVVVAGEESTLDIRLYSVR